MTENKMTAAEAVAAAQEANASRCGLCVAFRAMGPDEARVLVEAFGPTESRPPARRPLVRALGLMGYKVRTEAVAHHFTNENGRHG